MTASADHDQLATESKPFFQKVLPVFACGAGLFSDGYINNVRSTLPLKCPPVAEWATGLLIDLI